MTLLPGPSWRFSLSLVIALLGGSVPASAQMSWCMHDPAPSFVVDHPYSLSADESLVIATVPAGHVDVRVELSSLQDADLRVATAEGTELVDLTGGAVSGSSPSSASSLGMQIRWTGSSGIDGVEGHELVEIDVATEDLIVSVHTNAIGSGNVLVQAAEECPTSQTFAIQVQQQESVILGTIPAGTPDPWVETDSDVDIDIQLVDTVADVAIIRWPDGLLNGPDPDSVVYDGMEISYSGYNGMGGQKGDERFDILGVTKHPLEIRVFGYRAGQASMSFGGTQVPRHKLDWCWNPGPCPTPGQLAAIALQQEAFWLGTIPAGAEQPWIETGSTHDIDLQLLDAETNEPIARWPDGLLKSAGPSSTTYQGIPVDYSGYNGTGGQRGDERIEIGGTTTRPLHLFVYGYEASSADVSYAPEPSGVAALACGATALWAVRRRRRR